MLEKITEGYKAGYPGEDSMRTKAERLFKGEMASTPMNMPASFSAPANNKMRLYKKGGSVKKDIEGGSLTDLHLPRHKSKVASMKGGMKKGGHCYKEGGHVLKFPGSTPYEHHMVGESKGKPHINYESNMKGEKVVRCAKKEGGRVEKFAAGGVAKIRHKVATAEGMPITKKVKKGH